MPTTNLPQYAVPLRFRKIENLHIVFWLIKDLSWAMLWKPLGIAMFFPTFIISILITFQTRHIKSELFHNLAVTFWIFTNGYWMYVEFIGRDEDLRVYTAIPFCIGLFFIAWYYLIIVPREKNIKPDTPVMDPAEDTIRD